MTTEVRCTVHSCEFWGKGDYCTAGEIWVKNNIGGGEDDDLFFSPDYEFAEEPLADRGVELGEEGGSAAFSSHQTCCETMRPKDGKGEEHRGCCR